MGNLIGNRYCVYRRFGSRPICSRECFTINTLWCTPNSVVLYPVVCPRILSLHILHKNCIISTFKRSSVRFALLATISAFKLSNVVCCVGHYDGASSSDQGHDSDCGDQTRDWCCDQRSFWGRWAAQAERWSTQFQTWIEEGSWRRWTPPWI